MYLQPLVADESQVQVKVISREGEGHEDVYNGKYEGYDVRCQLAMTEQELAAVKRHLAESRRENGDLINAVSYLRSKLDAATATSDDTPTDVRINDNSDVTTATDAADVDDADDHDNDDDALLGQSSPAELDNTYNSRPQLR